MKNSLLLSLLVVATLTGCNSDSGDDNERIRATIDAVPPLCSEFDQRPRTLCPPDFKDESGRRYGTTSAIVDFEHQFGTHYELLLEVVRLVDPPADGFGIEYHILETFREEQDPIGTTYVYEDVHLVDDAFVFVREGVYSLPPYEFLCAADVDCDTLANMANSGGLVTIELTMTGGEIPVTVTSWN